MYIGSGVCFSTQVGTYNKMPELAPEAGTTTIVKRYLNKYMDEKELEANGPNTGRWDLQRKAFWLAWIS